MQHVTWCVASRVRALWEGFLLQHTGEANADAYFYFSATTDSTLGVGDLFPTDEIRLIAGHRVAQRLRADRLVGIFHLLINGAIVGRRKGENFSKQTAKLAHIPTRGSTRALL